MFLAFNHMSEIIGKCVQRRSHKKRKGRKEGNVKTKDKQRNGESLQMRKKRTDSRGGTGISHCGEASCHAMKDSYMIRLLDPRMFDSQLSAMFMKI